MAPPLSNGIQTNVASAELTDTRLPWCGSILAKAVAAPAVGAWADPVHPRGESLPHLEDSIVVDRPIDEVWAFLTDYLVAVMSRHGCRREPSSQNGSTNGGGLIR
jgi:hypothetical protein